MLDYRLELLDGTHLYSSTTDGLKRFIVDQSEAELGLHEAVKLLHPGDSARLVLPPHLAFGLMGDGNRIPKRATLVYHLKIVSVVSQND